MPTVPPAVIYCEHLANEPGKPACCTSCHDDSEARLADLTEVYDYDTDELTHRLCCKVAAWVRRQKCL